MKKCENVPSHQKDCNCTYEPCPRKGRCCDCLRYHWSMGELPACFFPAEVERTYDRSLRRFMEVVQQRGGRHRGF